MNNGNRGDPCTFSRGDSRFWWFSGSIKPFCGLTPCTRSHFSRERRSQYPFAKKSSIRPSKIDLLQIARQSLQGVPKSEINCSGGEDPPTPGAKRDFFFEKKSAHVSLWRYRERVARGLLRKCLGPICCPAACVCERLLLHSKQQQASKNTEVVSIPP